jgi:hypothetical protein
MKNYSQYCLTIQIGFAQTNDYIDISKKLVEAAKTQNQKQPQNT